MPDKPIPVHCLTVDVEDYFHAAAFRHSVAIAGWESMPSRVEANTAKVLELFDELGVRGTFFILGWVAERFPGIVRQISSAGHELGCHSYSHQLIYELGPESFRQDTLRALDVIQQASGERVKFYRAPSFSITKRSLWAIDILIEAGFTHDSSIFPIHHDLYGMPGAPVAPFVLRVHGGELVEFPPSSIRVFGSPFPFTGGGYLRTLPLAFQKMGFRALEKTDLPAMVYLHPWEFDPEQPRIKAPLRSRFRHYTGLTKTASRLRTLGREFRFVRMTDALSVDFPIFEMSDNGEFHVCPGETVSATFSASTSAAASKEVTRGVNACL